MTRSVSPPFVGSAISRRHRGTSQRLPAKRLSEKHQSFLDRQRGKVPGRRVPSRQQWNELQRILDPMNGSCLSTETADYNDSNADPGEEK
jgi:hypothetical protein